MQITKFCGRRSLYKAKCIQDRKQCHQGQKISDNLKTIQLISQLCPTLWSHELQYARLPVHHQLFVLSQTHVHWVGEAIQQSQLCHHFFLLPTLFASIKVFSSESVLRIRWPNDWSFSFSISPSNEYSVLISFRIDWFDLLAFQGTLKSLFQHHSSKASILWCSAFFVVQVSHPYMTIGKTIALSIQMVIRKVIFLLFNMLSRFVIAFLPWSKHFFIPWLQSPSTVILEPPKIKSVTVSIVFPSICLEVMGLDAMIFLFWTLSFKPAFSFSSFTVIVLLHVLP